MDTSPNRQHTPQNSITLLPVHKDSPKISPRLCHDSSVFKHKFEPKLAAAASAMAAAAATPDKSATASNTTVVNATRAMSPTSMNSIGESKSTHSARTISSPTPVAGSASKTTQPAAVTSPRQQPVTAQTKIPMKRTPTSFISTKKPVTPRGTFTQKQQMRSPSKVSLTIKELGGRKLDVNSSKLSFKSAATARTGTAASAKPMTARGGTGISRRSASTISCKSSPGMPKRDTSNDRTNIPQLPKVISTVGDYEGHNMSARERVAENNKLKVFETSQKKLQDLQTDFMQKYENFKMTSPDKLKCEFKFITMIKNDECKLIVKEDDLMKVPKKLPVTSINDFKEKIKNAFDSSSNLLFEHLKLANELDLYMNLDDTQQKLEKVQAQQLEKIYDAIYEIVSPKDATENDLQIVRMQKEILESKKALQAYEHRLIDLQKTHFDEMEALEKDLQGRTNEDVIKRDVQIADLQKKLKTLEKHNEKLKTTVQHSNEENNNEHAEKQRLLEEIKAHKENIHALNKKLSHAEQQVAHDKKDKHDKIENIRKLEAELQAAHKKMEEMHGKENIEAAAQLIEQMKEIKKLKEQVEDVLSEKDMMEQELENVKYNNMELCDTRHKLVNAEEQIRELQEILEQRQVALENQELPPEINTEIAKLRQSESEKRREIEKLRVELTKAHYNICQLEEQVQRDQQLLDVRSELINSLQTNDNSQRIHLDELFAQVGERNNTINEVGLNVELRTKAEEFRNLFTTLSTKQLELSRQEHMIKLLEESNDRSQMLRVKQEEKIGRMEEEIAHLKQTVSSIYQNHTIVNNGHNNKKALFSPVTPNSDYNENFYYFASERRRKRQVDINVKKYET